MDDFQNSVGDPDFDWDSGSRTAAPVSALDFEIPDYAPDVSAERIEEESGSQQFESPPPGRHLFQITGFKDAPAPTTKDGFVNGQPATYKALKIAVRLAVVGHRNQTILNFMQIPGPQTDLDVYRKFMSNKDGKVAGWFSRDLTLFLKACGFAVAENTPLPREAKKLGNWVGKRLYAVVEEEKLRDGEEPKINPNTGEPYPPRMRIKLMSYKPAGDGGGNAGAGPGGSAGAVTGAPVGGGADGGAKTPGAAADRFVNSGLANL